MFAIYDCCRVKLESMQCFKAIFVKRGQEEQDDLIEEVDDEAPCNYFHIQACPPDGVADGNGGFAKRI